MIENLGENTLFGDYAAIDPVYVDGIAGVFNLGANFSTMYFRWQPVRSDGGVITYERAPTTVLIQPRASLLCDRGCRFNAMLDALKPPSLSFQSGQNTTFN